MEVRQCYTCGRLFGYRGNLNCPECIKKHDDQFNAVRRYLFDNPKASLDNICEDCEVDRKDVMAWVRDGRLVLSSGGGNVCEQCLTPISSGRFCKDCSEKLVSTLEGAKKALESQAERKYTGMHTNRDGKR
jgi:predicted amidophosphoribosyltransferase